MATLFCGYGVTGSRKTTSMGRAARYMYKKTGKPGRLICADLGNWSVINGYVKAGIIEPFLISGEPNIQALLVKLARGYWPTKLSNGMAMDRHPVVAGATVGDPKMTKDGLPSVGFYIVEGLTSVSDLLMKYLRVNRIPIKGEVPSQYAVKDFDVDPTGKAELKFASNSLAHYGHAQDEVLMSLLPEFAALPVERMFFTAHESEGQDEDSRELIRGPALAGKKGTGRIGRNLGEMFHYEVYSKLNPKTNLLEADCRVYFESHVDQKFNNVTYPCKSRVPEDQIPRLKAKYPLGYFAPGELDQFLEFYDSLLEGSSEEIMKLRADIDSQRAGAEKGN